MVAVNDPTGVRTAELVWRYSLYMVGESQGDAIIIVNMCDLFLVFI